MLNGANNINKLKESDKKIKSFDSPPHSPSSSSLGKNPTQNNKIGKISSFMSDDEELVFASTPGRKRPAGLEGNDEEAFDALFETIISSEIKEDILQTKERARAKKQDNERRGSFSDISIGSLLEFKDEILNSIKNKYNNPSVTSSEGTENTEYYSVYGNSELRVRGIDVDNLVDKRGHKFGIYDLFKARFQQHSEGKQSIENRDVVRLLGKIMNISDRKSARSFLCKEEEDFKKGQEPQDTNWRTFYQHWLDKKNNGKF